MRQCDICRALKLKPAKVSYWAKTEIKENQSKAKKLNDTYIERIKRWAKNQTTSNRSSRKISIMINSILEKSGRAMHAPIFLVYLPSDPVFRVDHGHVHIL